MNLDVLEKQFKKKNNFHKIFNSNQDSKKEFQRLEFLGDRILGLVLAFEIYKKYPTHNEGKLANIYSFLTSTILLAKLAKKLNLNVFLKKKKIHNISNKVLSDVMEAILGSLYIDSGYEKVKNLIITLWEQELLNTQNLKRDSKSILQEWTQANGLGLPVYTILKKKGSDHNPIFEIELKVRKFNKITGEGKSLQIAEKKTAEKFIYKYLQEDIGAK